MGVVSLVYPYEPASYVCLQLGQSHHRVDKSSLSEYNRNIKHTIYTNNYTNLIHTEMEKK